MFRRKFAILMVMTLLCTTVAQMTVYAETQSQWGNHYKYELKGNVLGALDGYLQTQSMGGALAGSVKGAFKASGQAGFARHNWAEFNPYADIKRENVIVGDLHNAGLVSLYNRFQLNNRELSAEAWTRIDRAILTYVWENGLYNKEIDQYVRELDFSYDSMMARIKESTMDKDSFLVSEHFYSNLEKALELLEGEDEPEILIETFSTFLLESAAIESGEQFTQEINSAVAEGIKATDQLQMSEGFNNDIILANILVHFAKKGYDYYKASSDNAASRELITVIPETIPEGEADFVETVIPPKIRGIEIGIQQLDAMVGIDQVTLDVAPFIENDRTMIPFRFVGESLGAEIGWDPDEYSVTYSLGDQTVKLFIGDNTALVNGEEVAIDENPLIIPRIVNSRTMIPIRFISETLGFEVTWDPVKRTVSVMSNPYFVDNELSGDMLD